MYTKTLLAKFDFAIDVDGWSGSTHECVRLELSYVIHFSLLVTIFHKKVLFTLSDKQWNACVEMAGNAVFGEFIRYPLSELLYFSCLMQSQTVTRLTFNCSASSCMYDGFSFNNPCKSSASNFRGVLKHGRSFTLKLLSLKRWN